MSNSILTPAWKLDIKSSPKLVLISLADQANDDGWCICGIHHLMNRTGLSERAVQMQLNYLEDIGAVTRHRRRHQVTVYRVTPEAANCPRIVKIQRTVDPFDTIGSGAPTSTKTRPAKYAGLEKKTRKSCAPDPQNMRPDPAPDAPLPVLTIHTNPQPGESGEWGVLVEIWPKKGNIEEARPLFEALSLDDQQRIVALVPVLKSTPDWLADGGKWIPTLPAFIRKGRWRLFPDARLRLVASSASTATIAPLSPESREAGKSAVREAIQAAKGVRNG
jgi:hypothetical protein